MPSCSEQSTNPAGTVTGVPLGLAGAWEVADGVGSTAGVRVARFTTAITDATAINTAAIAKVSSPRRSHLLDGLGVAGSAFAGTGSSLLGGGGDSSADSGASSGLGASCVDKFS